MASLLSIFEANVVNHLVPLTGLGVARLLSCVLLSSPLGLVVPSLPYASLRHLWSFGVGLLFVYYVFGMGLLHLLLPSAAVYVVLGLSRLSWLPLPLVHCAPWLSCALSITYLMYRHLSREDLDAQGVDDVTLTMMLVVKLYTLTFALHDGNPRLAGGAQQQSQDGKPPSAPAQRRMLRALTAFPSVLEYVGYVFNPCTVFCGPAFEFSDYLAAHTLQPLEGAPPPGHLATRFVPAVWKLVQGVVWLALAGILQALWPTGRLAAMSQDASVSLAQYIAYYMLSLMFYKYSYYGIWKMSEGASVLAGYGFRGSHSLERTVNPAVKDFEAFTGLDLRSWVKPLCWRSVDFLGIGIEGMSDWEGANNVNPITVETRVSIQESVLNWNMHVQRWLQHYIFFRTPKAVSRYATFAVSAVWHGFYPGYYITIATVVFFQHVARQAVAYIDPAEEYSTGGVIVGSKKGQPWPRTARLAAWLGQWLVHNLFLMTYPLGAFTVIGEDALFPGVSKLQRIVMIYSRMGWGCHVAAVAVMAMCWHTPVSAPAKAKLK